MKKSKRSVARWLLTSVCLSVLTVILQACGGSPPSGSSSAPFPLVAVATTEAPGIQVETQEPLFADDFSNPLSGWNVRRDADAVTDYQIGEFVIYVGKVNTTLWSIPNHYLADVNVDVDAREAAGPDDNLFGVICRYQDSDNFYRFVIGGNGFAGITKRAAGQVIVLSGVNLERSPAVNKGQTSNHLKVICSGTQLSLYVNDQLVAQATDPDFQGGDVGLLASTGAHPGVEIHFTNFLVTQP